VLIVDDHPANRMAFRSLLEPLYTVALAEDGNQALDLAAQEDFAVILLDVRMPGMDGFQVAEALRKQERTQFTPIVFMSAYDKTVVQEKRGYLVGATDFLFSPIDAELLKFKVATYVQMTLRNESLRFRIFHLQEAMQSLREEISRFCPSEAVHHRILTLERRIEVLKLELDPQPA